jgi:hypothetical protein
MFVLLADGVSHGSPQRCGRATRFIVFSGQWPVQLLSLQAHDAFDHNVIGRELGKIAAPTF